ncbi:hypothetical protein LTR85_008996 [Meristemomyces frigidus]|nr:hypothetical protein LTR85_008996 [Meristemomyces frigidus]
MPLGSGGSSFSAVRSLAGFHFHLASASNWIGIRSGNSEGSSTGAPGQKSDEDDLAANMILLESTIAHKLRQPSTHDHSVDLEHHSGLPDFRLRRQSKEHLLLDTDPNSQAHPTFEDSRALTNADRGNKSGVLHKMQVLQHGPTLPAPGVPPPAPPKAVSDQQTLQDLIKTNASSRKELLRP